MTDPTGSGTPDPQDPRGQQNQQWQARPGEQYGEQDGQHPADAQFARQQNQQQYGQQYPGGAQPWQNQQYPPQYMQAPEPQKNTLGIVGLVIAVIGFIFACIPGALIVGWVLLPIGFIVSLVSLFLAGKKRGPGLAGVIVAVVGTVVGVIVFVLVVGKVVDDTVDDISSGTDVTASAPDGSVTSGDDASSSRENPLPLGSTVSDDEWSVTVNSVDLDASAAVTAENTFNDPAPEGMTYILVNLTVAYTGDSDDGEMPWTTVEYVTPDGNTIATYDTVALAPDRLDTLSDLYKGGSTTGNLVFAVPSDTAAEGVLAVSPGMFSQKAYVSVR